MMWLWCATSWLTPTFTCSWEQSWYSIVSKALFNFHSSSLSGPIRSHTYFWNTHPRPLDMHLLNKLFAIMTLHALFTMTFALPLKNGETLPNGSNSFPLAELTDSSDRLLPPSTPGLWSADRMLKWRVSMLRWLCCSDDVCFETWECIYVDKRMIHIHLADLYIIPFDIQSLYVLRSKLTMSLFPTKDKWVRHRDFVKNNTSM
jgi:hypothetical protein